VLCVRYRSLTGWSCIQSSPIECGVIKTPEQWAGLGPLGLSSNEKKYIFNEVLLYFTML
jgi:hypothetical protein